MVYLCYLYLFTYISVLLLYGVDGLFMLLVFIYFISVLLLYGVDGLFMLFVFIYLY